MYSQKLLQSCIDTMLVSLMSCGWVCYEWWEWDRILIKRLFVMRSSYRPHYASCPSVCPSVRPSVHPARALNSKTKKRGKIRIGIDVPHGTISGMPIFSSKGQRSRSQDVKPPKSGVIFTCAWQCPVIKRGRRRLHTRPTPLLGLLYCRRLRPPECF